MKALVYGVTPEPFEVAKDANLLTQNLARTPTALRELPDPQLPHEDWVITRPRLTGICGSDSKQILMDFGEGDADNAMGGFCSFPQVMGHEVVADVVALGAGARGLEVGQRVVLNPWLSCGPRAACRLIWSAGRPWESLANPAQENQSPATRSCGFCLNRPPGSNPALPCLKASIC